MALPPEVASALATLAGYVRTDDGVDDEKVKEVVGTLRAKEGEDAEELGAIAQSLISVGAGKKKGEAHKRERELTAEVTRLEAERDELQGRVEAAEASRGKPTERESHLEKERDKYKAKVAEHEAALKAEREGRKADRAGTKVEAVKRLITGQVDDDYLEEVLTPKLARRIRPAAESDDVEILDEDETPMDGDDREKVQKLAASVLKTVPDRYRTRPMNTGAGGGRGGAAGTVTADQLAEEKRRTREHQRF